MIYSSFLLLLVRHLLLVAMHLFLVASCYYLYRPQSLALLKRAWVVVTLPVQVLKRVIPQEHFFSFFANAVTGCPMTFA